MTRLVPLIILATLATGCRMAIIPLPNGKTAYVGSLLTDPQWTACRINPDGSLILEGYQSKVNAEATESVVSGAVQGLMKSVNPFK